MRAIIATRLCNLAAIAFTIAASALLAFYFDWPALRAHHACLRADTCDVKDVAIYSRPWERGSAMARGCKVVLLGAAALYWLYAALQAALEVRCGLPVPVHHHGTWFIGLRV